MLKRSRTGRPPHPLGFDYARAILDLARHMSYEQIAEHCGYASKSNITEITKGQVPPHPQGEAIWFLYREKFGKKPPMSEKQREGYPSKVQLPERKKPRK